MTNPWQAARLLLLDDIHHSHFYFSSSTPPSTTETNSVKIITLIPSKLSFLHIQLAILNERIGENDKKILFFAIAAIFEL